MRIVLISNSVTQQINSFLPGDINFSMYSNIQDMLVELENTPMRLDKLFITYDILSSKLAVSMRELIQARDSGVLRANYICIITDHLTGEFDSLTFFRDEDKFDIHTIKGTLTQPFIVSVLKGRTTDEELTDEIVTVKRIPISKYKPYQNIDDALPVISEAEKLSKLNLNPELLKAVTLNFEHTTDIVNIYGLSNSMRNEFAIILAQFFTGLGKTLIIDTDVKYYSMSNLLTRSSLKFLRVDAKEFISSPSAVVQKIYESEEQLIAFILSKDYSMTNMMLEHIISTLYHTLNGVLYKIVRTGEMRNLNAHTKSIVVMSNNAPSILETLDFVPRDVSKTQFIGIDNSLGEIAIRDKRVLEHMVHVIFNTKEPVDVPIYSIRSLQMGDDLNDYNRYR